MFDVLTLVMIVMPPSAVAALAHHLSWNGRVGVIAGTVFVAVALQVGIRWLERGPARAWPSISFYFAIIAAGVLSLGVGAGLVRFLE